MKYGSATFTKILSTQYTCTCLIPCASISSTKLAAFSALYNPPFPSGAIAREPKIAII